MYRSGRTIVFQHFDDAIVGLLRYNIGPKTTIINIAKISIFITCLQGTLMLLQNFISNCVEWWTFIMYVYKDYNEGT